MKKEKAKKKKENEKIKRTPGRIAAMSFLVREN